MPPAPTIARTVLATVLLVTFSGMIGAFYWAVPRLTTGRPLLPAAEPRRARWGLPTVLAVLLAYLAINAVVGVLVLAVARDPAAAKVARPPVDPAPGGRAVVAPK